MNDAPSLIAQQRDLGLLKIAQLEAENARLRDVLQAFCDLGSALDYCKEDAS